MRSLPCGVGGSKATQLQPIWCACGMDWTSHVPCGLYVRTEMEESELQHASIAAPCVCAAHVTAFTDDVCPAYSYTFWKRPFSFSCHTTTLPS